LKPYFEQDKIVIYHADARGYVLNELAGNFVTLTGPPWYEEPEISWAVIRAIKTSIVICQWNEITRPPCEHPLVAAHIWLNCDKEGLRYQPFYHFVENGKRLRSAIMQYPDHERTHPHDFPVRLAVNLLKKTPDAMPVIDPFCGTGATLIAAKMLGRGAVGVELDESRCEVAAKRLQESDAD
jgi:DNA modification methylase